MSAVFLSLGLNGLNPRLVEGMVEQRILGPIGVFIAYW